MNGKETIINGWYKWIFGQPAYIVILCAVLVFIGYVALRGFPDALDRVQEGYETINEQNNQTIEKLDERHSEERKELREERGQLRSAIENNTEAVRSLTYHIEHNE